MLEVDTEKLKNIMSVTIKKQIFQPSSPEMFEILDANLDSTFCRNKNICASINNNKVVKCAQVKTEEQMENETQTVKDEGKIDQNINDVKSSPIQQFYKGKNILITGATGFLGKILVEKLLRRCPEVENLYLLVRQKRGKDIYSRMEEIFEDPVFDRLKQEVPKFRHKIVMIPGDCGAAGLGLTLTDRQLITNKVNIIFHSAATVKFDEHLRAALQTNVRAPLHLLRLARDIKKLDVIMHISTAYSNSHLGRIEEKFYTCDADCQKLEDVLDKLTDKEVDDILPTVLGPWPNTYTFTKALAEKELRLNSAGVPIGIFRPAIVTSTAREPLKCWIDNMYGPTGVAVGSGTGILRTLHCDEDVTADIVPVDFVVNGLVAAAYSVHQAYLQSQPPSDPPIFNYVSSVENKITWGIFREKNMKQVHLHPFSNSMWCFTLFLTPYATLNKFNTIILHLLPAVIMDGLMVCVGQKPKMLKVYRKIHKFSNVISYFCTRNIEFCNRRTRELWDNTSNVDKALFPFSMSDLDWDEYFGDYIVGLRRYLFKESDDTLPAARARWKRLYYIHQLMKCVFTLFLLYALWSMFSMFMYK